MQLVIHPSYKKVDNVEIEDPKFIPRVGDMITMFSKSISGTVDVVVHRLDIDRIDIWLK